MDELTREAMGDLQRTLLVVQAELRTARGFSRNWAVIAVSSVFAMSILFVSYMSVVGLGALRQNTTTLSTLRDATVGGTAMLRAVQEDIRLNMGRYELIRKELELVEKRLAVEHGGGRGR